MKEILTLILALLMMGQVSFGQTFQTNILTGNISSFNIQNRTNVQMMMQITFPLNRTIQGTFISNDPIPAYSDINGNFSFTNVQWGKYILRPNDSAGTYFFPQVGTNVSGTWTLASLCQPSSAIPPNPASNYLTAAQTYALVSGLSGGGVSSNILWGTDSTVTTNSRLASIYFKFPQQTNSITFILTTN